MFAGPAWTQLLCGCSPWTMCSPRYWSPGYLPRTGRADSSARCGCRMSALIPCAAQSKPPVLRSIDSGLFSCSSNANYGCSPADFILCLTPIESGGGACLTLPRSSIMPTSCCSLSPHAGGLGCRVEERGPGLAGASGAHARPRPGPPPPACAPPPARAGVPQGARAPDGAAGAIPDLHTPCRLPQHPMRPQVAHGGPLRHPACWYGPAIARTCLLLRRDMMPCLPPSCFALTGASLRHNPHDTDNTAL